MDDTALNQVFIYGTLIEGQSRWPLIEDFVVDVEPDTARGHVFDTGLDYPAALFDATNTIGDKIHGVTITIDDAVLADCMQMLDEIEGEPIGLYHRVVITTDGGSTVWAYQYGEGLDHLERISTGSWVQHTTGDVPETAPPAGLLSAIEARVIGSMIEKAMATPQNYPLSVNSLVAACNQKSSRDPVTDYTETEVMDVLTSGKERRLVRFVHPTSGHGVTKYRHVFDEFLGVDEAATALLGVLMLRGPQTPRELRDRTDRMYGFDDTSDVEAALAALADRDLVMELERQPGQRDARWVELLTSAAQ